MGRLTRDPEVRYSQGERQMEIARYTLAVDRPRRQNQEGGQTADFISCVAFDKAAAFAEKYLFRGTKIAVTGHIQTGSYTNKDNQKVYTTDVIVESQEFCESKASQSRPAAENARKAEDIGKEDFMSIPSSIDDIGLPFN